MICCKVQKKSSLILSKTVDYPEDTRVPEAYEPLPEHGEVSRTPRRGSVRWNAAYPRRRIWLRSGHWRTGEIWGVSESGFYIRGITVEIADNVQRKGSVLASLTVTCSFKKTKCPCSPSYLLLLSQTSLRKSIESLWTPHSIFIPAGELQLHGEFSLRHFSLQWTLNDFPGSTAPTQWASLSGPIITLSLWSPSQNR